MFGAMDGWDWALAGIATYVAVVTLVRLMADHRNKLLGQVRDQIAAQRSAATPHSSAETPAPRVAPGGRNTAA